MGFVRGQKVEREKKIKKEGRNEVKSGARRGRKWVELFKFYFYFFSFGSKKRLGLAIRVEFESSQPKSSFSIFFILFLHFFTFIQYL